MKKMKNCVAAKNAGEGPAFLRHADDARAATHWPDKARKCTRMEERVPGNPGDWQELRTSCSWNTATRQKSSGAPDRWAPTNAAWTYPVEQPEQPSLHGPSALGEHRAPSLDDGVLVGLSRKNAVGSVGFGGVARSGLQGKAERRVSAQKSQNQSFPSSVGAAAAGGLGGRTSTEALVGAGGLGETARKAAGFRSLFFAQK